MIGPDESSPGRDPLLLPSCFEIANGADPETTHRLTCAFNRAVTAAAPVSMGTACLAHLHCMAHALSFCDPRARAVGAREIAAITLILAQQIAANREALSP